jgi:benzoyl-CoA reductase subunit B
MADQAIADKDHGKKILGRGALDGGRLFREWFEGLTTAPDRGEKTAYVFVMGSLVELLRVFDFQVSFPEINSLQTAVRRVALDYLNQAEDYGYSPDICGYVKADVGVQLRGGQHPMGKIPRPSLAVLTNGCNTYIKWAEIWERMYHMPTFTLDVPGARQANEYNYKPGDPGFERDRKYVEYQIRELIPLCEKLSGKKFDIDRLRENLGNANRMAAAYRRVLELNRAVPAPFNALSEGTIYLGVGNVLRGHEDGARYFEDLAEEMEYKVAHHIGTLPEEKYRLIFVGVPCYPIFRKFYELFATWGGVFVSSTYLQFAAGGLDARFDYDLKRPLEAMSAGLLMGVRHAMDSMFFEERKLIEDARNYHVDGIVFHPIKSCRTVSTGLADKRRAVNELSDVMSLFIESDLVDKRVVSEAQMKNRIDAFFEGLASRKLRKAGTEALSSAAPA